MHFERICFCSLVTGISLSTGDVRWSKGQSVFEGRAEMDNEQDATVSGTTSDTFIPGKIQFTGCGIKFTVKLKSKVKTTFRREGKGNENLIF